MYFASFNITSVFFYLPLSFPREFQSSSSRQNSVFPDKSITVPCLRMLAQTMEPYLFSISHKMHPIYYGVDCIIYLKSRIVLGFLFKACQCNCPILIQLSMTSLYCDCLITLHWFTSKRISNALNLKLSSNHNLNKTNFEKL